MTSFRKRIKRKSKNNLNNIPKTVNIFVAATMSAGKSSLINALLGSDLLWSANEAATASITRIHHSKTIKNSTAGACFDWNGNCREWRDNIDNILLHQWNAHPEVKHIELSHYISRFASSAFKPIIYDTPGANNSQDPNHAILFNEALNECQNGMIIYVLNATQLGTKDDAYLLSEIKSHLGSHPAKKIIFVLNKIDEIDEEKDESIQNTVNSAQQYLEKLGFSKPVIIPSMMHAALIAQKILANASITRLQRSYLKNELIRFRHNKHLLNNAARIPNQISGMLNKIMGSYTPNLNNNDEFCQQELIQFINYSGLTALELYLKHYL
nr:dynamin family protein [Providencia stuartii]ELR5082764.1 dynamin family protein [Providencia stuartii]